MTSDGSPYARFQHALRIGRLSMVRAAAAELPRIDLDDALAICLLIEDQDAERYERAAVRWHVRFVYESKNVGMRESQAVLALLAAIPVNSLAATALAELLSRRRGLERPCETLVAWARGA